MEKARHTENGACALRFGSCTACPCGHHATLAVEIQLHRGGGRVLREQRTRSGGESSCCVQGTERRPVCQGRSVPGKNHLRSERKLEALQWFRHSQPCRSRERVWLYLRARNEKLLNGFEQGKSMIISMRGGWTQGLLWL